MFSPIKTGTIMEYFGFQSISENLSGLLDNPEAIASAEGREFSSVIASGRVSVQINCLQRNMGRHGYVVNAPK